MNERRTLTKYSLTHFILWLLVIYNRSISVKYLLQLLLDSLQPKKSRTENRRTIMKKPATVWDVLLQKGFCQSVSFLLLCSRPVLSDVDVVVTALR